MRTVAEMVAEAKSRVRSLSPSEVAAARDGGTLLVDLREPEERAAKGTIAGAVFAPRGMLEFWADPSSPYHRPEFDPEAQIILYCASGGRSALAATLLEEMGYGQVAHLEAGWPIGSRKACRSRSRTLPAELLQESCRRSSSTLATSSFHESMNFSTPSRSRTSITSS